MSATKLLIENLDREATENHIRFMLSEYGDVSTVRLNRKGRRAVVEMATPSDAMLVKQALDGASLWGRSMKISVDRAGFVSMLRMLLL